MARDITMQHDGTIPITIHCQKCGNKILEEAKFCAYCGAFMPPIHNEKDSNYLGSCSIVCGIPMLLIDLNGITLFDLDGMEQELSEATGHKINLLTEGSISPYLIDRIKKDLVVLA
jgi:hypothetical protein